MRGYQKENIKRRRTVLRASFIPNKPISRSFNFEILPAIKIRVIDLDSCSIQRRLRPRTALWDWNTRRYVFERAHRPRLTLIWILVFLIGTSSPIQSPWVTQHAELTSVSECSQTMWTHTDLTLRTNRNSTQTRKNGHWKETTKTKTGWGRDHCWSSQMHSQAEGSSYPASDRSNTSGKVVARNALGTALERTRIFRLWFKLDWVHCSAAWGIFNGGKWQCGWWEIETIRMYLLRVCSQG